MASRVKPLLVVGIPLLFFVGALVVGLVQSESRRWSSWGE